MFLRRNLRIALAWAVLFAVLFNVALPTMAAMRTQTAPVAFGDICFASGVKQAALSGDAEGEAGKHADLLHDGHCNLCMVQLVTCPLSGDIAVLPMPAWPAYPAQELPSAILSENAHCLTPPSQAPPAFS